MLKNSLLRLIWVAPAVYRCDNWFVFNFGLSDGESACLAY